MALTLYLGDLSYSSWSMRAGLLRDRFDLPVAEELVSFLDRSVAAQMATMCPRGPYPPWWMGRER